MKTKLITALALLMAVSLFGTVGCSSIERRLLFYPTHRPHDNSLTPWTRNGKVIGYARLVESPKNVWLMLHGNAGQASDRLYAVPSFSSEDSVYILEYPGYGNRQGTPSKEAFDHAAREAYEFLRECYPHIPVCVVSESINVEALSHYHGPVEIIGAESDTVIPVRHAKALAAAVCGSKLKTITGGHNDWSRGGRVAIRN